MNQNFNFPLSFGSVAIWSWPSYNISPTWISLKEGHFPCYSLPFRGPGRVSGRYDLTRKMPPLHPRNARQHGSFASFREPRCWLQGSPSISGHRVIKWHENPQTYAIGFLKGNPWKLQATILASSLMPSQKTGVPGNMPATSYIQPVTIHKTPRSFVFFRQIYTPPTSAPKIFFSSRRPAGDRRPARRCNRVFTGVFFPL